MASVQLSNQLFIAIFGMLLAALFASTVRASVYADEGDTHRYWLRSVGTRSLSLFAIAAVPWFGSWSALLGNVLFLVSAGYLALLFRSWRKPVSNRQRWFVILFPLTVGVAIETVRQFNPDFGIRMLLLGSASISITAWELTELRKHIQNDREPMLRVITAVVFIQVMLSISSVVSSMLFTDRRISYATENSSASMYVIWATIGIHFIIYFFIAAYIYQRAFRARLLAVREKNDVTRLLEERERLLASLIVSNRIATTGALSASVAHEISQPLTAATLKLALLKRQSGDQQNQTDTSADLIGDVLGHIHESREILNYLRQLFRQGPRELQRCRLDQLVASTISIMRANLNGVAIEVRSAAAQDVTAHIVEKEVQQVLVNLINNALDALATTEPDTRRIQIDITGDAERVMIAVADNGAGVRPELTDSLFELARTDKQDGMGIGLWLSRYIIEEHHRGRLFLDRDHAPGACFVIELPRMLTLH